MKPVGPTCVSFDSVSGYILIKLVSPQSRMSTVPHQGLSLLSVLLWSVVFQRIIEWKNRLIYDQLDPSSPYNNCHKMTLYNGKPDQYWYYTRIHSLIANPPKVPHNKQIQKKALFICDVIDNEGSCIERQVWVNNGEKKVKWDIAQGVNAVQNIGGKEYGFYINTNGPHWVRKDTLTRLNRRVLD